MINNALYDGIVCKVCVLNNDRDRSGVWQKKSTLKKHPSKEKKTPLSQKKKKKHFWSRKKALSKHYFINKKQQESTYN